MANIPHKYTQEAQAERHWEEKRMRKSPKSGSRKGYNRRAYRDGFDDIEWTISARRESKR